MDTQAAGGSVPVFFFFEIVVPKSRTNHDAKKKTHAASRLSNIPDVSKVMLLITSLYLCRYSVEPPLVAGRLTVQCFFTRTFFSSPIPFAHIFRLFQA